MFDPIINNNNDDDIFDDSKSLSDTYQNPSTSNDNISPSNADEVVDLLNKALGETIDGTSSIENLEKLFHHLNNNHNINVGNIFSNIRYNLVETFYEGYHRWMSVYRKDRTSIAVYTALTDITNNRFPLFDKYYQLELDIIKRTVVIQFLEKTFLSNNSQKVFKTISSRFNCQIDDRFIKTYFTSVYNMSRFTLLQDIAVYKAIAKELNLEVKEEVLSGDCDISTIQGIKRKEDMFKNAITPSLKESISENIRIQLESYEE